MKLKLRIGGVYLDGEGRTVTIFEKTMNEDYTFRGYYFGKDAEHRREDIYTDEGYFILTNPKSSYSLVEEVVKETKMKLEVGKRYRNREGNIVLVEDNHTSSGTNKSYPFCSRDDYHSYTELGTCFVSGTESKFDLLEEVILTRIGTKMLEIGKTYKDNAGGITTNITAICDDNYPFSGTHTDVNGVVSTRTYTDEGIFNLEGIESRLDLIVEVEVEKPKFEVGKYYRSQDGILFRITKIWAIENNFPAYPIEAIDKDDNKCTFTMKGSYFADNDASPCDLVCLEVVLDEEQEDDLPEAEIKEEKDQACESTGSNSFNSVEEVFLWLANGNKVQHRSEVYTLLTFPYKPSFVSFRDWVKYVKPEPVRWFHNIPAEGIICWVWDNDSGIPANQIAVIVSYLAELPFPFRLLTHGYCNARPLTKEELLTRFSEDF